MLRAVPRRSLACLLRRAAAEGATKHVAQRRDSGHPVAHFVSAYTHNHVYGGIYGLLRILPVISIYTARKTRTKKDGMHFDVANTYTYGRTSVGRAQRYSQPTSASTEKRRGSPNCELCFPA